MNQLITSFVEGGPVVWTLFAFSVFAATIAVAKFWQFAVELRLSDAAPAKALDLLDAGDRSAALQLVNNRQSLRARIIRQVLHVFEQPGLAPEEAREEAMRQARLNAADLTSYLRVLEVIATLAPLLGLLGTVMGMIEAFKAMEIAGANVDPAVLSGGIWQALLTTAIGLAVAIPVSLLHSWFERRSELEAAAIENQLQRMFTAEARLRGHKQPSMARAAA
ncbi:MotA/TolQ/ExbB proton channel family protein [Allohahella marinimesophila]|uniref:MotA/TolQ/ExbB proton channel domain-containing protein n=1 Tax=Allohahella marinimesophila TaxID=1054972 RepID=A0ABP7NNM6_9GAMM